VSSHKGADAVACRSGSSLSPASPSRDSWTPCVDWAAVAPQLVLAPPPCRDSHRIAAPISLLKHCKVKVQTTLVASRRNQGGPLDDAVGSTKSATYMWPAISVREAKWHNMCNTSKISGPIRPIHSLAVSAGHSCARASDWNRRPQQPHASSVRSDGQPLKDHSQLSC
jgi:hypothetical protein